MADEPLRTEETQEDGALVCEKCGSVMIKEGDDWYCPHCQGEIDFLGDEDE